MVAHGIWGSASSGNVGATECGARLGDLLPRVRLSLQAVRQLFVREVVPTVCDRH